MIKYLLVPLAIGGLLLLSLLFAPVSIYLNQFKSLISPYQFEYSYAEGTILESNIEDVYLNEYDLGTFQLSSSFTFTDLELLISTTDKFFGSAKILAPFASIAKATFNVQEGEINYLYKTSELGEFNITTTIDNASFVSAQCVDIDGTIIILNESFRDSLLGIYLFACFCIVSGHQASVVQDIEHAVVGNGAWVVGSNCGMGPRDVLIRSLIALE